MLLRDAQIPLLLWLSAAALIHLGGGSAASATAAVLSEHRDILAFGRAVREVIEPVEVEVELLEEPEDDKEEERTSEDDGALAIEEPPLPEEPLASPAPPEPEPEPKPEPEPEVQDKQQPEPEKKAAVEPPQAAPQQLVLPKPDGRIAVKQHVEKDQEDNPNASRIADDANHTREETMARIRAYDQDSPEPSPGESTPGPQKDPGNSHESEPGFAVASEEPGETRPGEDDGDDEPLPPAAPRDPPPARVPERPASEQQPAPGRPGRAPVPAEAGQSPGAGEHNAEPHTHPGGDWSLDPTGGDGKPTAPGRRRVRGSAGVTPLPGPMGFGAPGRHNLTLPGLMDAIGEEQLRKERERARNTRKRKHRGAFSGADFQRYRAAIENYDPSVKLGNQTSLNAARVPFATFINRMHNRIHPIFADSFLGSLNSLPRDAKLNQSLVTHLEIVLDREQGKIVRLGVTKPSGVTAYDMGALKSVESASPFGPPPEVIVSPDGLVYVHWEFHRDPYYACTSRFARPYLLKNRPKKRAGPLRPEKAPRPPSADERHGRKAPKQKPKARGQRDDRKRSK